MINRLALWTVFACWAISTSLQAQNASIKEEKTSIKTYPFSDPDPVPILTTNPKIYPYFSFDGYTHEGKPQDWNVVHLENDHIELWVLPQAGGKVWGAKEKSTGQEYIYRNEVMKFRNIAMRGPWTSGGIEFNFGIIGHHPSTATPVDYALVEEPDGSVSCWVGNIDLPSRTQWRVKISLPKDKAYFETKALWYNPTPIHQSYYNWMTAAAFATDDLEFFCPGNLYLEHGGDANSWPKEYGRHIAEYSQNNFLSHKSYHVVGEYNDFFGGYYHKSGYGFGHLSAYDEMPGQKLWLWSLARDGGIWEDLLTDTDGQYIEFQAGRLFNQYSPGADHNPITQTVFQPHVGDQWQEIWFPVKEIGGLSDVSSKAILYVETQNNALTIGINALEKASGMLRVSSQGKILLEKRMDLLPMQVVKEKINWSGAPVEVTVEEMGLSFQTNRQAMKRPFEKPVIDGIPAAEKNFRQGIESMEFREFVESENHLKACLMENPAHLEAMASLAELYYRQGLYDKGLIQALRCLSIDTYHPYANYIAGILFRAQKDYQNALEMLGWAARSMEYRSAAYAGMAEIFLLQNDIHKAILYAGHALDYNRFNIPAIEVSAIANRLAGNLSKAQEWVETLQKLDPLSHLAHFERYLLNNRDSEKLHFLQSVRNELPYQSYLELAISYYNKGQKPSALKVLDLSPSHPLIGLWKAFLNKDETILTELGSSSPAFVFPFRRETLEALEWADNNLSHWKIDYYLALCYWANNRRREADSLLVSIGNSPDYAPFYLARAAALATHTEAALQDLQKAKTLQPEDWRVHHELMLFHHRHGFYDQALSIGENAYRLHPDNYTIGMDFIRALVYSSHYEKAIEVLKNVKVLPFENASEGRHLYELAHLGFSIHLIKTEQYRPAEIILSQYKQWPERLGVGKPFNPDERLADFLLAHICSKTGRLEEALQYKQRIVDFTLKFPFSSAPDAVLGYLLMGKEDLTELNMFTHQNGKNSSPVTLWALAKANLQTPEAARIQSEKPDLFKGLHFEFLEYALQLR